MPKMRTIKFRVWDNNKQEICPYCHSDGSTRWDNKSKWGSKELAATTEWHALPINLSDNSLVSTELNASFSIRFCPMCGRKLKLKGEKK